MIIDFNNPFGTSTKCIIFSLSKTHEFQIQRSGNSFCRIIQQGTRVLISICRSDNYKVSIITNSSSSQSCTCTTTSNTLLNLKENVWIIRNQNITSGRYRQTPASKIHGRTYQRYTSSSRQNTNDYTTNCSARNSNRY